MYGIPVSLPPGGSPVLAHLRLLQRKKVARIWSMSFVERFGHPLRWLSVLLLLIGHMGAYACDTYDINSNRLTIPIGAMGTTVFTDVVVTVDLNVAPVVAGGAARNTYDSYSATTNRLVIPCVQVGNQTFNNVTVAIDQVISVGAVYSSPVVPVLRLADPQECASVGQDYALNVVAGIVPPSTYTYMLDTLAIGNGVPPSMTLDMNGILSGKPFATGGADVNGNQVRHNYTFGVCAVDTLSRTTTKPCPQITVCVDPQKYSLTTSVVGSGTISASSPGPSYSSGTAVTLTATPGAGYTFTGWSGACSGTGSCVVTMSSNKTVTATFTGPICANGATDYPACTPPRDGVTPGSVRLGNAGTCSGGKLTTTFQVTANSSTSWTARSASPPVGGGTVVVSPASGTGSGTISVTITVPPQSPSSSYSSCSLTYNMSTLSDVYVTFSDGTIISVTAYWTFVGVT